MERRGDEDEASIIRETNELVRRIHALLWWQRLFAWVRFLVFIVLPIVVVWAVLPRLGAWQQEFVKKIEEAQRQLNPSKGSLPPAATTLEQWCKQYCGAK